MYIFTRNAKRTQKYSIEFLFIFILHEYHHHKKKFQFWVEKAAQNLKWEFAYFWDSKIIIKSNKSINFFEKYFKAFF